MTVPTFSAELVPEILREKVISIVAEAADIEEGEVGFDDNFVDDLGLDSLGIVGIFVDLSYEFEISQPQRDEDWHVYNTPRLVCEFAIKQLAQKSRVQRGNG
jgi:acyl carrier protein